MTSTCVVIGETSRSHTSGPKASWHRFAAEQPNERWQADLTHWQLADGTEVEILNILDDHSRLAIGSTVRRTTLAPTCHRLHQSLPPPRGIPARALTANAAIFTGYSRGHGRVVLELELRRHWVIFDHCRPYHP